MKYLIPLLLFSNIAFADITRYYACNEFTGIVRVNEMIVNLHDMDQNEASRVAAEIALVKIGESKLYDVPLDIFFSVFGSKCA